LRKTRYRLLGHDPGRTHYGIAAIEVDSNTGRMSILQCGEVKNTISNIARSFRQTCRSFRLEIKEWVDEFEPDAQVIERFMTRGIGGTLIEEVGISIGIVTTNFRTRANGTPMPFKLLPASQWKNDFNRKSPTLLNDYYPRVRISPHQIDAALLARYGAQIALGKDLPFHFNHWTQQFEKNTRLKLINRRK